MTVTYMFLLWPSFVLVLKQILVTTEHLYQHCRGEKGITKTETIFICNCPSHPGTLCECILVYVCICILSIFNKQHLLATVCIVRNSKTANSTTRDHPCRWKGLASSQRTLIQLQHPVTCIDFRTASWVSIGSDRILPHCPCAEAWFETTGIPHLPGLSSARWMISARTMTVQWQNGLSTPSPSFG